MNSLTATLPLTLSCHSQTPSRTIQSIDAVVRTAPGDILTLSFALQGDLSRLRIPETRPPRRAGNLWAHTCLEVFAMAGSGPGYREFNFSPSGEWAVYDFRAYRDGGELDTDLAPAILARRCGDRLEVDVKICHDFLPQGRPLRLGLSAVVEDTAGGLSYWALRHPPGKPDFHHADAFALQLELPGMHDQNKPA
jgi:hypothetical protein